ncbi:methylamine utilization protein MauE [Tumebacillus sp. BK434]|uniref:MauE/DoxX family redox-associated membrane protein n=1 Tax=Tumebacillus sp. BK434 TaxID=2512169 RepID=UPI00104E87EB|nr:MauE/DoxX family redox-associated membrane protein [Tumebacillus sp. BK434]TCP52785.1 methylamine utilization protein MauE [Tumebacillus sp. BK434]
MDDLAVWFRFVLAFLFLSTAWSKHKTMGEHIGVVRDYQLLPERLTEPFAKAETYVELLLGLLLLLGLFQPYAAAGSVVMLLIYTGAITVNLWRGRTEMSCGCGGVAGLHRISWKLVLRNLSLACAGAWVGAQNIPQGTIDALLAGVAWESAFDLRFAVIFGCSVLTMLAWTIANELGSIQEEFRTLLEGKS